MRSALLFLHISGGLVGLLSGAAAMVFRKGSDRHRLAGSVFVISMLIMGSAGAYLAFVKDQANNMYGGMITVYMVATAWAAGRRREVAPGILEWGGLLVALAVGGAVLINGFAVATGAIRPGDGVPAGMYFFLGGIAWLAAVGDLRMLVRGGISGVQRVTRHLWRMSFALFVASGSFFLGKQQHFPAALRGSMLLVVLAVLPLLLLIFWMIRVRFPGSYGAHYAKAIHLNPRNRSSIIMLQKLKTP